jgi:hypothetical protein
LLGVGAEIVLVMTGPLLAHDPVEVGKIVKESVRLLERNRIPTDGAMVTPSSWNAVFHNLISTGTATSKIVGRGN